MLDRQARRLKKLTEDVLEASKAATGNIKVELGRTDAVELLGQCLAEYVERFQTASLTAVMQTPGKPAFILADGRCFGACSITSLATSQNMLNPERGCMQV